MYRFVILAFLLVFRLFLAEGPLRLRPRPLNFFIRLCLDSFWRFETISLVWSEVEGLASAMSDRMSPPVRNVSRPRALTPLQIMGRTQRIKLPKKTVSRARVEDKEEMNRCALYHDRIPLLLQPVYGSTVLTEASVIMCR